MLQGSIPLFYELLSSSVICNQTNKLATGIFTSATLGKISKLKRYAKELHRLAQRQVKTVVIERWVPSCRNILQISNVLFTNMF